MRVYVGLCRGLRGGLCGSMQVYVGLHGSTWRSTRVYVEVYVGLCGGPSLFVLGYHWFSLATIDLVGDNREFEV